MRLYDMKFIHIIPIAAGLILSSAGCKNGQETTEKNPEKTEKEMNENKIKNIKVSKDTSEFNLLTEFEHYVIVEKGTERPGTGELLHNKKEGVYTCKRCNQPLFTSNDKFESHCGWPSFDDAIEGAVKEVPDADGRRIEILCSNCDAHLGHVFEGEGFTPKNVRHCVNSVSIDFIDYDSIPSDSAK